MRWLQGAFACETGSTGGLIMPMRDVIEGFIAQDRATGVFYDVNVLPVRSLRYAARADSIEVVHETMGFAILEGRVECPDGYEVHSIYELDRGF